MKAENWLAAAGDLLLGASCPGCERPWWGACPRCRELLLGRVPAPTWPDPTPAGMPLTITTGPYADELRGLLTAHKEEQALLLTRLLGRLLARSAAWLLARTVRPDTPVRLVPMPSSPAAVRRRGFDATLSLARHAAARLRCDWPAVRVARLLGQRRAIRDQAGLTAHERQTNLVGALRLVHRPGPAWVVLVDDVVTTGATLTEAGRVLSAAGVSVLGAATVAATQRRSAPGRS